VVNLLTLALGPLVEPECRRAVGRGWLILVRTLAALTFAAVTMIVLWQWWIWSLTNPQFRPYEELRDGLLAIECVIVGFALLLAPAVLAGSLAGEKERGSLALLLTTRVSPREIVLGRVVGKLTQVAMILLAGLPAQVLLIALTGMNADVAALVLALPVAVSLGAGGLAAGVSAVSRRGRDALLTVYLVVILFMMAPLPRSLGVVVGSLGWLESLNPFLCLESLAWNEQPRDALLTVALWLGVGALGAALASLRLAPACLAQLDGSRIGRKRTRRGWVRPLDERRPMLWKELYVERARTLGGLGWWLGLVLVLLLAGGSLTLGGVMLWARFHEIKASGASDLASWAMVRLHNGIAVTAPTVACLIEWAIGLRAAVTIASERERGTWDAILTSPLEAFEILVAKLWGSLYALRWLVASAFLAWTIAAALGAMPLDDYIDQVVSVLAAGTFMAAVGVRSSLACATATRAMTVTIGIWLGSTILVHLAAWIFMAVVLLVYWLVTIYLDPTGAPPGFMASTVTLRSTVWIVGKNLPYVLATVVLFSYSRLLFDRLAGRRAGGAAAVTADRLLHGGPLELATDRVGTEPPPGRDASAVAAGVPVASQDG
jgi:ABC-type Na+ efflux pump permease subunit